MALSGASSGFFGVALPEAVARTTEILCSAVGCGNLTSSEDTVECLRTADPEDLNYWGFIVAVTFRYVFKFLLSLF